MRALTTTATLATAALLLTACTNDTDPNPSNTGTNNTTSQTSSAAPTPSDQSTLVNTVTLAPAQGSTTGTLEEHPATLNIGTIKAGPTSTILTYWLTGAHEPLYGLSRAGAWSSQPTLTDPAGQKIYHPLTYTNADGLRLCLCTLNTDIQNAPQPHTVAYPPLPDNVTSVQVRMPGFPQPVTANITRLP